jgi:hypothetical protein
MIQAGDFISNDHSPGIIRPHVIGESTMESIRPSFPPDSISEILYNLLAIDSLVDIFLGQPAPSPAPAPARQVPQPTPGQPAPPPSSPQPV